MQKRKIEEREQAPVAAFNARNAQQQSEMEGAQFNKHWLDREYLEEFKRYGYPSNSSR
jgi:hypothetical protein